MTVRFSIPYPTGKGAKTKFTKRFGLNSYYAGKHWGARKADAEELHKLTLYNLRRCRVPRKTFERKVLVIYEWDDGLDSDNHAVLGKAILDAMKGWVVVNDDRRYVRGVVHLLANYGEMRVTVTDEDVVLRGDGE